MLKFIVFTGLFALGCTGNDIPKSIPGCVANLIQQIKNQGVWNPPARIYRYVYKGQTVYFVPQRCCDIPSTLYDENCHVLCFPDGGFTGAGDGKCNDFFTSRSAENLIWQDTRK